MHATDERSSKRQTLNIRMDYTNHKFGKQPAELFEIPAGFSPLPSFGAGMGVPGGVPGGAAMPSEAEMRKKMEALRARVDSIVDDPATAEALKPYYRFLCKRPGFHDEYTNPSIGPT